MGTSTLHLNNPVPSNGAVAASLGGRHTVTVTLAGVGAISCKVQAWASSNNTDSKMLGAPVVISGTTTVSQTLTFDAGDCNQFWLALVEISPACTFNATVENSGDVAVAGAIIAQNSISSFLPGQTAGVPDTASLTVAAGVSQRVALPTGTVFRLDWSGYGPFAFRFGSSSVVAVATDFPGTVGLPQYFEKPAGTTHIAVYGIGGGTLVVSGGSQP